MDGSPHRGFPRLWWSHSVSQFGDQLTLVALPLAAYADTDSAVAVGVVASLEAVTAVGFGLVAGALADRLAHRRVLVLTDVARAVLLVALVAALAAPGPDLAALLVAATGLGLTRVLHDAAESAAVPLVVEEPRLVAANGRLQASEAAATAAGPAVAGALHGRGGPPLAFAADAVSFVASGAALTGLRSLDDAATAEPPDAGDAAAVLPSVRADVAEGVRRLWADRPMVRVLVLLAAVNVVSVCVEAQFVPYAREVLGLGGLGIGAYFALGGVAAVVTSLLAGRAAGARGDAIVIGLVVFAGGVLVAGLAPSHVTAGLAYVGAGVGSALAATHAAALRQSRFPVRFQGRVSMAVRASIVAVLPVPLIAGGWLADAAGPEALFITTAVIGLVVAAWGAVRGVPAVRG
ncbi:MAG: transporter [Acidimicrobiales bacterium]|nr:transporter [Acidimicrobiales bacterium]